MKKLLITLVASIALAGCVTNPEQVQRQQEFNQTLKTLVEQRNTGAISQSTYYEKAFENSYKHQDQEVQSIWRDHYAAMLKLARLVDSNQMSAQNFDDERRARGVKTEQAIMALDSRRKAEKDARFNNALQGLAASQALMNANRPPPPAFAPSINCRSRNVYGTIHTDCN